MTVSCCLDCKGKKLVYHRAAEAYDGAEATGCLSSSTQLVQARQYLADQDRKTSNDEDGGFGHYDDDGDDDDDDVDDYDFD